MKAFEIWSEGFRCTGDAGHAYRHASAIRAETFKGACDLLAAREPSFRHYYTWLEANNAGYYWGCKLFDNETDARRSFG